MSRAVLLILIAALAWWLWSAREMRHLPGVLAPVAPVQTAIPPRSLGDVKGYHLEAQAAYLIQARVLRTKRYWVQGADLVPYDVAVGWGAMSDQSVLDQVRISQSNRFFFYEWPNQPPIDPKVMVRSAANMHLIAANLRVARTISSLRAGQIVTMKGYLVNASKAPDFSWNSSLRRDDDGNGACELMYVEAILVGPPEPAPATPAPSAVAAVP